jgi:putative ABC transport system substrate-binding protein
MNRRDVLTLIGGAAAAHLLTRPLAAQPETMPVIGFLQTGSSGTTISLRAAFLRGLKEAGYVEDQNVRITYRGPSPGRFDRRLCAAGGAGGQGSDIDDSNCFHDRHRSGETGAGR